MGQKLDEFAKYHTEDWYVFVILECIVISVQSWSLNLTIGPSVKCYSVVSGDFVHVGFHLLPSCSKTIVVPWAWICLLFSLRMRSPHLNIYPKACLKGLQPCCPFDPSQHFQQLPCISAPPSMKKLTAFRIVQTKFSLSPIATLLILKQIPNNSYV